MRRHSTRIARSVSLAASVVALAARGAAAAWPHDPNVGVPLSTAVGTQQSPSIVSDGAGGAIVAWQDSRNQGTKNNIYVQRVSAAGAPQWTLNGVALSIATGDEEEAKIVSDGAGGAIVTWDDQRADGGDIYARRVNAAGVPQWTANGVALCTAADYQVGPEIISDGAGGAIVAWLDHRSGTTFNIYAQRVSAAGVPQWTTNGVVLSTGANPNGGEVQLTSDGAGGAIVTWEDDRSGNYDVYAQRVSAAGTPLWTANGVALCTAAGDQGPTGIVSDGAGGAIVTWEDVRSGNSDIDVYAQRVNAVGAPQWTSNGVALCAIPGIQDAPTIISDGTGGAIVTWQDNRSGTSDDVYAQRVNAAGTPLWIANGEALCAIPGIQDAPTIISDGAGGAIVTWQDYRSGTSNDIYAQRVNAAGAPQWTPNGLAISIENADQDFPVIVSDGAGGAIVTWYDHRNGNYDIYAQRVNTAGAPQWATNGVAISTAAGDQRSPAIDSDGAGGAIIAWTDFPKLNDADIYAQRIERFGQLGNPEPAIAGVRDIPNDQGGKVKVTWSPSYLDADPHYAIHSYSIWRSVPPSSSWENVGSQPARGFPSYSLVVPTSGDSVAGSNPFTVFKVEATSGASIAFWDSAPDSGYSVDNLPPAMPVQFTGAYAGGATHLHWDESHEADLAGYRLYRGASSDFVPGAGSLIAAQPDTGFSDVGVAGNWYKLSAVDVHGNESLYQVLGPNGTLDAPGTNGVALSFAPPAPNPVRGTATFRFGLPSESEVALTVFDQQGRRVRELAHGVLPAGNHTLRWDGRDGAGHVVASGIYFARLEALERTLRVRFAVVR